MSYEKKKLALSGLLEMAQAGFYPSLEAEEHGWAAAMSGEFRVKERQTGRGERARTRDTHLDATCGWRPARGHHLGSLRRPPEAG